MNLAHSLTEVTLSPDDFVIAVLRQETRMDERQMAAAAALPERLFPGRRQRSVEGETATVLDFDVKGCTPLRRFLETCVLSAAQLRTLLEQILQTLADVQAKGLFVENLLCDASFVFVRPADFALKWVYLPAETPGFSTEAWKTVKSLLKTVAVTARAAQAEALLGFALGLANSPGPLDPSSAFERLAALPQSGEAAETARKEPSARERWAGVFIALGGVLLAALLAPAVLGALRGLFFSALAYGYAVAGCVFLLSAALACAAAAAAQGIADTKRKKAAAPAQPSGGLPSYAPADFSAAGAQNRGVSAIGGTSPLRSGSVPDTPLEEQSAAAAFERGRIPNGGFEPAGSGHSESRPPKTQAQTAPDPREYVPTACVPSRAAFAARAQTEKASSPPAAKPTELLMDKPLFAGYLQKSGSESILDRVPIDCADFTIGREKDEVRFCIGKETVSKQHAKIEVENGACFVTDSGSSNGTFLNGVRLEPGHRFELHAGDSIAFARESYRFFTE